MTVLRVNFGLRQLVRREADAIRPMVEPRDEVVRKAVLERCGNLALPSDIAHYFAAQAAQIVRRNPTRETSGVADNAVRQALQAVAERNRTPPTSAA
jgi:hypothetical protein